MDKMQVFTPEYLAQWNVKRVARRKDAEASVNLTKTRAWYANSVAYGFIGLVDLFSRRIADNMVDVTYAAVQESIDEYQREINALMDALVQRTTDWKRRYILPSGGTLQPLDEWGNPLPVQPSGSYDVAFPIQGGGTAWGDDRVSRALMNVGEANANTLMVQAQDVDWLARHMLAALFTNTTWTYTDKEHGSLTIQPLANSDSVTYVRKGGSSSTDSHYLAEANAIDDGADNPFPIIEAELSEHPSNSGDIIVYVPTNLVASIRALATFRPANDPNLDVGTGVTTFSGSEVIGFGDKFLGYEDSGVKIVEWKRLPNNYMIAISSGADPILAMREYPAPELQGLFPEFQDVDGNRHLNKFIRYAGFGVQNRVGALVYYVGVSDTYAIPTGYTAPLKV
jgi:hypothetical protein